MTAKKILTPTIALLLVELAGLPAADLPETRRTEDLIYGRKSGMALTMDVFHHPTRMLPAMSRYANRAFWVHPETFHFNQNHAPAQGMRAAPRGTYP